ncbi:RNA-guided endonuclease InsQ/TnpB family protein [Actinomadura sp. LOL_011]|uniref:RNA-guided endonuclease InsQ/TnpB family protein n=1 Tax=Actinomadura sp. LOL_011 TaxID=3345410 RepID=UPI003A80BB87
MRSDGHGRLPGFVGGAPPLQGGGEAGPPAERDRESRIAPRAITANARWSITGGGKLALPKIGALKVKWTRALPSTPATVTVVKDAAGRYFCSFVVETADDPPGETAGDPSVETGSDVGIDLGLEHFAVLSDGRKIASPRFLRRAEKKLRRAQQALSCKQEGSNNRGKARLKVARAHAGVADARREFHHTLSTALVRESQAVYVEDLCVKGLARTRLVKSVHDAGWSTFVNMLEYKAARYGRTFVRVDRAFPSSQICSHCGRRDGPEPLHVRAWACGGCGAVHDRDVNAARNILDEGRRSTAG